MKKVMLFAVLILMIAPALAIDLTLSNPTIFADSNFVITGLKYEPYPVLPGEQFTLWVKIDNKGTQAMTNASCLIKPEYPFTAYGSQLKNFGELQAGDSLVEQFTLKVDEKAAQGTNNLELWCTENYQANAWKIEKIPITVQTRYPTLNIKEIRTEPKVISPGEDATLLFSLENLADSAMKDVDIKLNLSGVEIASSGEVAEKKLRTIDAGAIADLMFSIKAMPGATGGIYKIPFTLNYNDYAGTAYSQDGLISIEVAGKTDLIVSVDSTAISQSSRIGNVDIKIVNSGLTNLKFATAEILDSENYKVLSNEIVYIGDIDSDDFGTASYKLSVKSSDDFDIPMKITFRDAVDNEFTENVNVKMKMLSNTELGKGSSFGGMLITILIIFIILMVLIRKLREKVYGFICRLIGKKQ